MSQYKVCHLSSVHKSNDIRIFHKECVSIAKYGYDTTFIAINIEDKIVQDVKILGIKKTSNSRIIRMLFTTRSIYKKALGVGADIYHFHDPELIPVGLKLKKKGAKVIYDVHEDVPLQLLGKHWINPIISKWLSFLFNKYEKEKAKKMDHIITSTPTIRNIFLNYTSKVTDINNYPKFEEFDVKYKWDERNNELCYIGGIFKIRGIFKLLDILEKYHLNLAGVFSPPELENELKEHNNWEKVNYYGMLNREEIRNLLGRSKIGMLTLYPQKNFIESQPIKLFEYMMAGIPVIASDFPLWKEIVEKNNCGICVDPLNKNAIANAIDYLMKNQDIAEEMGKNGRKVALEKYNWTMEEKKLIEVYKNLLGVE